MKWDLGFPDKNGNFRVPGAPLTYITNYATAHLSAHADLIPSGSSPSTWVQKSYTTDQTSNTASRKMAGKAIPDDDPAMKWRHGWVFGQGQWVWTIDLPSFLGSIGEGIPTSIDFSFTMTANQALQEGLHPGRQLLYQLDLTKVLANAALVRATQYVSADSRVRYVAIKAIGIFLGKLKPIYFQVWGGFDTKAGAPDIVLDAQASLFGTMNGLRLTPGVAASPPGEFCAGVSLAVDASDGDTSWVGGGR